MAKTLKKIVKLQVEAGKATPAPPLGPALGQAGVNIGSFTQEFNEKTREMKGLLPVVLRVYDDRSFDFEIKKPLASWLIKKAAGVEKGSGKPGFKSAAVISRDKLREIAEAKMSDLNASSVETAMNIIEGQARSMGIQVK